jgi:hypothetical protein
MARACSTWILSCLTIFLLSPFASGAARAQGSSPSFSGVDYGPLGQGTVHISFLRGKRGDVVELGTSLDSVVGIVLTVPSTQRNLVALVSHRAEGAAKAYLSGLQVDATLMIDAPSLAGQRPQVLLQSSLAAVHQIEIMLVGQDGQRYPLVFDSQDFAGQTIDTAFSGAAGECHEITLSCSNGCNTTVNCCSVVSCSTCSPCGIVCGSTCLQAAP